MRIPVTVRFPLAGVLGVSAALLVSCGGGGKGLIPPSNAGPLQSDFDNVAAAVDSGDCTATETALRQTETDLENLPSTVDSGLRNRLREGVANLRSRAITACSQAQTQSTSTTGTTTTTTVPSTTTTTPLTTTTETTTAPSTTTNTTTTTTPTTTTTVPSTTTTASPPPPGGGTPGPGAAGGGNGQ